MSTALYNEIKAIKVQILNLLIRIESLEETRAEARKKRPVLTMPIPETPSVAEWARNNPSKAQSGVK